MISPTRAIRNSLRSSSSQSPKHLTWFKTYLGHAEENLTPEEFFLRGLDHDSNTRPAYPMRGTHNE